MTTDFALFFILTILSAVFAHGKMSGEPKLADRFFAMIYSVFCVGFAITTTLAARNISIGRISANVEKYDERLTNGEVYETRVVALDGNTKLVLISGNGETRVMRLSADTPTPARLILDNNGKPLGVEDQPKK